MIGRQDCALGLEFPVVGTVAILSKSAEKGLIAYLLIVMESLRLDGFRILLKNDL